MRGESGSIIPLGVGVISISAIVTLVLVELIGVQFQTLQSKQVADVLVLQVAGDLNRDGIAPVTGLEYFPTVRESLASATAHLGLEPLEVSVMSEDGKTVAAIVCSRWKSVTGLTLGSLGKVCASSKARAIA